MAEKWTIRELSPEEYPGTQLRYEVRDETDVVSLHSWEEDAQQMAAVPDLRSDLRTALEYIAMLHRAESSDDAELDRILSALKKAKGE
jgi:hypothetical protein